MNSSVPIPSRQYAATLRGYLAQQHEATLHAAYELGRKAIAAGLGVLDMARLHQQALASCLTPEQTTAQKVRTLRAAETFFMEALSPFEAAHRGFREANQKLHQLNAALERRNAELGAMNRRLAGEISQRKRSEKALRESKDHYRQLFHQACLMQENLRNLSNQILHVQEAERKRISRELHDEIGQALTAVSTNLQMVQRNGSVNAAALQRKIVDSQSLLAQTMDTVHQFARELRPAMLDELGLLPAVRSYLKCFAQRTGLRVRFNAAAAAENLDEEQKTVLFRITQESLNNVAKHAQASQVSATLRKLSHSIRLDVRDNGKGFQVKTQLPAKGRKRLGLLGMQERVRLVNGRFAIHSNPGKGTTIRVDIPLPSSLGHRHYSLTEAPLCKK